MNKNPAVDAYLAKLPAWQAAKLEDFRTLIHSAGANVSEEIKWNVPAFTVDGKVTFTMAAFKSHVKYNFIKNGAKLADTDGLFNNGLESNTSRGIDLKEDESINLDKLSALITQALKHQ